jgi:Possible hemagglutinin (DUF637).
MLYYLSTSNEQELEELHPWVYFPEAMIEDARGKRGGKIRTHMLAIIEAGMLPREMINAIQDPRMQQAAIKFFSSHPDVARLITERADEYWRLKALEAAPQKNLITDTETQSAVNPASGPLQVHPDEEEQEESQEGRVEIVSQSVKRIEGPGELQDHATYAVDFGEAAADPGRGVHASYTVHPIPADGNCFFHAAFTGPNETPAQITARAAQIRNTIPTLIRNNPAYLEMLRPEVLAGAQTCCSTLMGCPNYASPALWQKLQGNQAHSQQRSAAQTDLLDPISQREFQMPYAELTNAQQGEVQNIAERSLPAHLRNSQIYSTADLLGEIDDEAVAKYAEIYKKPTTFIEIPTGRDEKVTVGHMIALDQGIRINRFCFRADTGKLTYNGFVGQADSSRIVNVLFKDSHFWRLVNEDQESPDRTLAIRQAAQNDSDDPRQLASFANSAKTVERPNQSARTPSPSGAVTIHGEQSLGALFVGVKDNVKSTADITADRAMIMSFDKDVMIQSETTRIGNSENFTDVVSAQARLETKKDPLYIYAGRNVLFQGAETHSKGGTYIAALIDVYDIPLELVSQQTIYHDGKYKGREQLIHINNHVSKHSSGATIDIAAGRRIMSYAVHYNAKKGRMYALDDIQLNDVINKRLHSLSLTKKGSFGRQKNIQEQSCTQISQGGIFNFSDGFEITVAQGAPTLTNPTLNCPLTVINAPHGTPRLNLGVNTHQSSSVTSSSNAAWQKQRCEQQNHRTYSAPRINGILEINAQGAIAQAIQGQTLEYLNQIKLNGGKLTQEILHELHEVDIKKVQGPSAALSMIITITAGILTQGAGAQVGSALTGTLGLQGLSAGIVSGMAQAATTSLIAQTANSLVANQGDFGKVAKDLSSRQNLRALRNTMVKAALLGTGGAPDGLSFPELVLAHASQSIAGAGLDMVLEGTKPKEALTSALQNTATGAIGTYFANKIRAAYKPSNPKVVPTLNWFDHKLAHMGLGLSLGAILNPDNPLEGALEGAGGAFLGEVLGEAFSDAFLEDTNLSPEDYAKRRELGIQLAKLGAAAGALAFNRNPDIMVTTAENAAAHNAIPLIPALLWTLGAGGTALTAKSAIEANYHSEMFMDALEQGDEAAVAYHCEEGKDALTGLVVGGGTGAAIKGTIKGTVWTARYGKSFWNANFATHTAEGVGQVAGLMQFLRFKYGKDAVDAGITWGKGIHSQGMPWENYLSSLFAEGSRLPKNFKTFDYFERFTGLASSAKTLNTMTPARIAQPRQTYSSLKKYIDDAAKFTGYKLGTSKVKAGDIITRELHLAVPQNTTITQWGELLKAAQYAQTKGIVLKITKAK